VWELKKLHGRVFRHYHLYNKSIKYFPAAGYGVRIIKEHLISVKKEKKGSVKISITNNLATSLNRILY